MTDINKALETTIEVRNKKLKDLIYKLSANYAIDNDEIIKLLKDLYSQMDETSEDYRHFYSIMFCTLVDIKKDEELSLDVLFENLNELYKTINSKMSNKDFDKQLYNKFIKLYDHLNLELARINYTEAQIVDHAGENEKKIAMQKKEIKNIATEIKDSKNLFENLQKDYVSILGIFASIVLAFNGALSFGSNMISNLNSASIYRLIFIGSLFGLILNSTICALTNIVTKIWKNVDLKDNCYKTTNGILIFIMIIDSIVYFILR